MYLGSFAIDDYVGIPASTHRFSSGAAYAPTVLTYSIYEEATAVGLDEDVDMVVASPFDSITGCYWVRRQLTAAAGFEAGKNYLVVVKATVDGVAAIQMHTFQVLASTKAVTVSDKTGYALSQSFPANFASLAVTAAGKVTVGTNDDKAGYTASTVSDKTGYSLASPQTFDLTGNITGNLSGSVGSVSGAVGSVTGNVGGTINGFTVAAKAEIQTEAEDALVAHNLDHLVKSAVDTNFATTVHADSVIGHIADNGAGFDRTTDSLEAIRDKAVDVEADAQDIQNRIPVALVGGRIEAIVGAMANDTLTASALAANAVTEIQAGLSTLDVAGVRSAVGLASANLDTQLDTLPTAAENATAVWASGTRTLTSFGTLVADIWAHTLETGWTVLESLRVMLASAAGKLSGAGTTTVTIRDAGDSKNRITATVDESGNRTAVTYDKT